MIFSTHQEPIPRGDQIPVTIEDFVFFNIFGIFSEFLFFIFLENLVLSSNRVLRVLPQQSSHTAEDFEIPSTAGVFFSRKSV